MSSLKVTECPACGNFKPSETQTQICALTFILSYVVFEDKPGSVMSCKDAGTSHCVWPLKSVDYIMSGTFLHIKICVMFTGGMSCCLFGYWIWFYSRYGSGCMQCSRSVSLMQCRHMPNIILFCLTFIRFISFKQKKTNKHEQHPPQQSIPKLTFAWIHESHLKYIVMILTAYVSFSTVLTAHKKISGGINPLLLR